MNKKISVIAIMKNEEANVAEFLRSADKIADEIIINDTGSTDNSIDLAISHKKVSLIEHKWENDFSKARNQCLKHVTGDYVLWLDLDDRIYDDSAKRLRILINEFDDSSTLAFKVTSIMDDDGNSIEFIQDRLFPSNKSIEFEGIIHETFAISAAKIGLNRYICSDIEILHLGYKDEALRLVKSERNIKMLYRMEEGFYKRYNLGMAYQVKYEYKNALDNFLEAYYSAPSDEARNKCIFGACISYLNLNDIKKATEMYDLFTGSSIETLYLLAEIYIRENNLREAFEVYKKILEADYKLSNLGVAYNFIIKRAKEAVEHIGKELQIEV